jgi:CRISPR-associated protein Cmr5
MNNAPSLAQRRAAHALECVKSLEKQSNYGNYVAYVSALPATILMNGLGQACATLLSKRKVPGHEQLYIDLQSWLCMNDPSAPFAGKEDLMDAIATSGQDDYFRAHTEALAYLVWLKKLANACLERGRPE